MVSENGRSKTEWRPLDAVNCNHPSGNVKPSKEDMIVTRKLQKCGQLLGIELLDHIIVGGTNGKMLSFREEKMLNVTGRMDWER